MTYRRPRILDASALVELVQGHPEMMRLLDDADAGHLNLAVPTLAIAEAQVVLAITASAWDHIMEYRGVTELPLSTHAAVDAGDLARPRLEHHPVQKALIGPLMVGQVIREATTMGAVIYTRVPEAYGGHDVAITTF